MIRCEHCACVHTGLVECQEHFPVLDGIFITVVVITVVVITTITMIIIIVVTILFITIIMHTGLVEC